MKLAVETEVAAPLDLVWRCFNDPQDILQWDRSDEWQTIKAENDPCVGGTLKLTIVSLDGRSSFDVSATYLRVQPNRLIEWQDQDGRMVCVDFIEIGPMVKVRQTFDADPSVPEHQQRADWKGVIDGFARYVAAVYLRERAPTSGAAQTSRPAPRASAMAPSRVAITARARS